MSETATSFQLPASGKTLHKVYLIAIAAVVVLAVIVGSAWSSHVKDEAKRDAVIDAQKSDIAKLEQSIGDARKAAQEQIAALEQQKQQVIATPAQAPMIIREVLPRVAAEPRSSEAAKPDLPDAPAPQLRGSEASQLPPMTLTEKDQQDLAQFILSCKQCSVERDQLAGEVKSDEDIIARQKTQLDASLKAAKGGSVWQRTKTILKWGAIFGGVGYAVGRSQR